MARKRRRLNVRFLVILVSVAGVLLVGLAVGAWWYKDSPGRAVRRAQEAEARGDWEKAAEQWAKAWKASNDPTFQLNAIDASLKRTADENGSELLQQIHQSYVTLLAADPTMLPALRGQMRLLANHRSFAAPSPTNTTRDVRRLASDVLKQEPGDSEARTLYALATINLQPFTGEGISEQDVRQAELELRSVAETDPGDGLAVLSLTQRMLQRADQARVAGNPQSALELWQETVRVLDNVVARHGRVPPTPTLDDIRLQWRIGQAYTTAARVKPILDAAKLQADGTPAEQIDVNQLSADPVVVEVAEKGHQHVAAARNALDDDRDVLKDAYRDIRMSYADALVAQGRPEEGEEEVAAIVEKRPWDTRASAALARLLQQKDRVAEAVAVSRAALEAEKKPLPELEGNEGVDAVMNRTLLKPVFAEILLTQHDVERNAEEKQKLLAEAKATHELYETERLARGFPATSESTRVAAQIQIAEGELGSAVQTLTSALRFTNDANSPAERRERLKVLALLVDANRKLGQTGAQQVYLEEMTRLAPGLPRVKRELAEVYISTGQHARAREIVSELQAAAPNDASLNQLALQATPPEERDAVYAQLPETTPREKQIKLAAAARLGKGDEVLRIAGGMRDALPAAREARSPEQQREYEGLTMMIAQQQARAGRKDEAVALLQPLAETNATAKAMLTQVQGGADALVQSLPEGATRLLLESELAAARGDESTAMAKLEEAREAAPENSDIGNKLFNLYLGRGMSDKAAEMVPSLQAADADLMNGRSYPVRLALARGEAEQALRLAVPLATEFPEFAEALALHAEALRQVGRPGEAIDQYRRALDLSPNTPAALMGLIASLEAAGRFQEAREFIDAGLRLQPNNQVFRNADRTYAVRFGDPTLVIADRRTKVQENPENVELLVDLGQTLVLSASGAARVGDTPRVEQYLAEAQQIFRDGLQKFPAEPRLLQGLVLAASQQGEEALGAIEPVVESSVLAQGAPLADEPTAIAVAADFFARRNNLPRAESIVRGALQHPGISRDRKAVLLMMLNDVLLRQGRAEDAVAVLSGYEDIPQVLQRKVELLATQAAQSPTDESLYRRMRDASDDSLQKQSLPLNAVGAVAYAEMQRGNMERAVSLLDAALQRQPNNHRALLLRGAAEARRDGGSLEQAAQLLERARQVNPNDPDTLREFAVVQRRRGLLEQAIDALNRMTEVQPQNVATRLELINTLLGLNPPRYADAARQFRAAERAGVDRDPRLLLTRARMERLRGRIEDALPFALQAVEAQETPVGEDGPSGVFGTYLALLLEAKRPDEVLSRTEPMTRAEGGAPWWIARFRGQALAESGRRDAAVAAYTEAFNKARAVGADEAVLLDMRRHLDFDAAWQLVSERVNPAPGSGPASLRDLMMASSLHAANGDEEQAIAVLEQVRQRTDFTPAEQAALNGQLGTLFLQVSPRQLDKAIEHLRQATSIQPDNLGLLNNLSYALSLQSEGAEGEAREAILAEAVETGRKAYELNAALARRQGSEQSPTVIDTYGWAQALQAMSQEDTAGMEEALARLSDARRIAEDAQQNLPEIYLHQSRLLAKLERGQAAQEAAEAGLASLDRMRSGTTPLDPRMESELRTSLEAARELAIAGFSSSTSSK